MQVDSIKTSVEKRAWCQRLKPRSDKLLSNFAFNCNLRRYIEDFMHFSMIGAGIGQHGRGGIENEHSARR